MPLQHWVVLVQLLTQGMLHAVLCPLTFLLPLCVRSLLNSLTYIYTHNKAIHMLCTSAMHLVVPERLHDSRLNIERLSSELSLRAPCGQASVQLSFKPGTICTLPPLNNKVRHKHPVQHTHTREKECTNWVN